MIEQHRYCGRCFQPLGNWTHCYHCNATFVVYPPVMLTKSEAEARAAALGPVPKLTGGGMSGAARILISGGLIIVVLLVLARAYSAPGNLGGGGGGAPTAPDISWVQSGFTPYADGTVAYRWLDGFKDCEVADSCWGMEVIARDGCPSSLYVELSIINDAGTAVGYTNDVAGAVERGQMAQLVFDNFEKDASKARLTKIFCY